MNCQIENGPVFTVLRIQLAEGESFRAEPGSMIAMSPTIKLEAKSAGKGIFGALKAAAGGESFFASLYTAVEGDGEIVLAPSVPGDIMKFEMTGRELYAQGSAYMAGSPELTIASQGSLNLNPASNLKSISRI